MIRLPPEVFRFAVTGIAAYATDLVVFNALILGTPTSSTWAKVASSAAAIVVAFVGSRWYTWRGRRSDSPVREWSLFVLFSVLAALLQLACLVVSRDAFGLRSALADNVSANVVGMGLATLFRFWTFRTFVFPAPAAAAPERAAAA